VVGATLVVVGVIAVGVLGVGLGARGLVDGVRGVAVVLSVGVGVVAVGDGGDGEGLGVDGGSDSVGDGVLVRVLEGVGSATERDGVGIEMESDPDGRGRLAPPSHDDARTAIVESATSASARDLTDLPLRAMCAIEAHGTDRLGIPRRGPHGRPVDVGLARRDRAGLVVGAALLRARDPRLVQIC
jgi:hypothetical protein